MDTRPNTQDTTPQSGTPAADTDTITTVTLNDRVITLLGTAHVSRESTEEVKRRIRETKPD
ncbi:MAG: hypothetical protein SVR04_07965, partial [Spirochaetota bacterium]|nr:hypothetical protein [Spirochaetota bacterium]